MSNVNLFINYLVEQKRYAARTAILYERALHDLFSYVSISQDGAGSEDLNSKDIRSYTAKLMEQGKSGRTVRLQLSAISSYYRFLVRQGTCKANPVTPLVRPKTDRPLPDFYAQGALNDLLDEPADTNDFMQVQAHAALHLLYATGIRRAELAGLRVADVDFSRHLLRVKGKGGKSREVPLTTPLSAELQNYIHAKELHFTDTILLQQPLFTTRKGAALPLAAVNTLVKNILNQAQGISGRKTPHRLRHSLATHLLNNGADIYSIKEVLGHSSLAATQIYTHNDFESLKKAYKHFHPRSESEDGK